MPGSRSNQRRSERLKHWIACTFSVDGIERPGRIANLSPDSLFVEAEEADIPSDYAEVEIQLTLGRASISLCGWVARRNLEPLVEGTSLGIGFGVRLAKPDPEYLEAFERLQRQERSREMRDIWRIDPGDRIARYEHQNLESFLSNETQHIEPAPRSAVVIDRGELQDVFELVQTLGLQASRVRLDASKRLDAWTNPPRVLIAAAHCALSFSIPTSARLAGTVTIAVAESESNVLAALLQRLGYRYVVRRPFHPEALRLLLMEATYGGTDRREHRRHALGYEVQCRLGARRFASWVQEISAVGCRLHTPFRIEPGARISLHFPPLRVSDPFLRLRGQVVRCGSPDPWSGGAGARLGLHFDPPGSNMGAHLENLVARASVGPVVAPRTAALPTLRFAGPRPDGLADEDPAASCLEPASPPLEPEQPEAERPRQGAGQADSQEPSDTHERRSGRRAPLRSEVIALQGSSVSHVLVGRDLSPGGLHVEPHPGLDIGDRLTLAIPEPEHPQPTTVEAEVIRDDGRRGMAIRFLHPIDAEARPGDGLTEPAGTDQDALSEHAGPDEEGDRREE